MYSTIDGRSSWDAKLNLFNFPDTREEISFWQQNIQMLNKKSLKVFKNPREFLFTDASSSALGAFLSSSLATCHRNLSNAEQQKSSTWRELLAVFYAVSSFLNHLTNKSVLCHTDNLAASRIISVGSSIPELQNIALAVFDLCKSNYIDFSIQWIPRETNIVADKISKFVDVDDWQLSDEFFSFLNRKWGPFTIDRFANTENTKLVRFNSKYNCPDSEACDAFFKNWENESNLLVPPVKEIPKVLERLSKGRIRGVLVVPYWTSASFWPLLIK